MYYMTTDCMRACGMIDTFYIFGVFKVARIFDKKLGYDAYGVKHNPWPNTLQGVCSKLGPWSLC